MIFTSPVRFFRKVLSRPPAWGCAFAPVGLAMVLVSASSVVAAVRGHTVLERAYGGDVVPVSAMAIVGVLMALVGMGASFWLSAGALLVLDLLFAGSGRARRLVEFSALAYWVQVVWAAVSLIAVLVAYSPSPLDLPISRGRLAVEGAMAEYLADESRTPFMLSIRLVGVYFGLWFTALQACALRVVSGFSVVAASAAGVVMGFAFILLPWAVQRF